MWSGPASLYLLIALSHGPRHGLGIADEVARFTDDAVILGPGTLYRVIRELSEDGWIRRVGSPEADHPHRKYYELTPLGRDHLAEALQELEAVAAAARKGLDHLAPGRG